MSATTFPAEASPEALRAWRKAMKRARRQERGWRWGPLTPLRTVLMVLGFIAWWPIGLALLALFAIWRPAMTCNAAWTAPWTNRIRESLPRAGTGNLAFDEHRAAVLARLEEERRQLDAQQAEFGAFMQQLRRAKDQEEFDRFMAQRARGD
jgi:hypothetical protein